MSRRSKRLGTAEQEEDRISTSSVESHILHRDSPVVRSLRKKATSIRNAPPTRQTTHHTYYSETTSYINKDGLISSVQETDYNGSEWGDSLVRKRVGLEGSYHSSSKNGLSEVQPTYDKSTSSSGYSSEEDYAGQPYPSENAAPISHWSRWIKAVGNLPALLFSFPGRMFGLLYWWLGTTWYRLTTSASLLDVFILTRHYGILKKALIILFLLLLFALAGLGLWRLFPFGLGGLNLIPSAFFSAKHKSEDGTIMKQDDLKSQGQSLYSEAELLSRMESLERKFQSAERSLNLLQQQGKVNPKEAEVSSGTALTREQIVQIFTDFSSDREAALMEGILQQGATMNKNELNNLREEQVGNIEAIQQKLHQIFKEMDEKILQLKRDLESSGSEELSKKLLLVERKIDGELVGIKDELNSIKRTQVDMSQRLESVPGQIKEARDEVELLFPKWFVSQMEADDGRIKQFSEIFLHRNELQQQLLDLEKKILAGIAADRKQWAAHAHTSIDKELQAGGLSGVSREEVNEIVNRALQRYSEDRIGLVDYALESSGASVINTRCSETYETKTALLSLFGIPLWYQSQSPRVILQPDLNPGNCWAFRGSQGYAVIRLSSSIRPTAVTLDHIPRSLSPKATISSAPKDFSVYGLVEEMQKEGTLLGNFTYNQYGESIQTFPIQGGDTSIFQLVELRIQSNWGHPEYTCIYRFRVHGESEV
ncbi:hypothetical protein GDO86_007458 [Hymenochirus boettgeri]|uniref:SUN domain-containing protein n=1 Tax=Hymenochirus boettgeri TaxID=247094 RepID=A0A8T2J1X5_9PIPI|nr:hypothetical protein GDO86_007458 [Hymenochirus boettgeri]KAG8436366.1 hypothetical protein GDO86_007458 [Hymenochirus boettgeri]